MIVECGESDIPNWVMFGGWIIQLPFGIKVYFLCIRKRKSQFYFLHFLNLGLASHQPKASIFDDLGMRFYSLIYCIFNYSLCKHI